MTTYKTKVVCDVEYYWEPSDEDDFDEFQVLSFKLGDYDFMSTLPDFGEGRVDEEVYQYLKENKDA